MELALIFIIYIMWKESNHDYRKNTKRIRTINDDHDKRYLEHDY